jgi:F-type H+-transporting ATPase subunit delta
MRGASRDSFAAAREQLESLLRGRGAAAADPAALGEDLFGVTALLDGSAALRRALTDPSKDAAAKQALVRRLLEGKVRSAAVDVVATLAAGRWAAATDVADAAESLGVQAVLAAAERNDRLEAVEDELFRFSRSVAGTPDLRDAFSVRTVGTERKAELVRRLLAGKVAAETALLAAQAATAPRGLRTEQALERYVEAAADRRRQLVAHVIVARPLSEEHRRRLAGALERIYGRAPRLNVDVDPEVIGGLRVQVGGELIDGTMLGRLESARRRLAS